MNKENNDHSPVSKTFSFLKGTSSFETFKGNVCHLVKSLGDLDFIITILENDDVTELFQKGWYPESLYLLAMLDYLCRENNLPICTDYNSLRHCKFSEPIYPAGIITLAAVYNSEKPKQKALSEAIPEFLRFNIVENDVRNIC